ncbi:hypothetical protein [Chitinophaga parva]|uniref:hypothetical protein n=1 Tax=Chitinophaga parva TaxID=2169414 RepID=UPI0010570D65|nr:hypothetical protein [Chitinophaga parva]
MNLRIYLRHYQLYDANNNPVYYDGTGPTQLRQFIGPVPNHEYVEYTDDFDGLDKLRLSWSENETDRGDNVQAGLSNSLTAMGDAYTFIMDWLNDHVAAPLNAIEAVIEDYGCGKYASFLIKADGIAYCDDGKCNVDVNLKQADAPWSCIEKTLVTDNWQGWFPTAAEPLNAGKQHPRYTYCDEFRPAFFLGLLFSCISMIALPMYILSVTLVPVVLAIITIASVIIHKLKKLRDQLKDMTGWGPVTHAIQNMYLNAAGCGREMPSPLVRDYIANVCDKCGIKYSKETIPMLFDPTSDYYNLTWTQSEIQKGVKKDNTDQFWIEANDPLITLDMLLNKLKDVFNAKWRIAGNVLYFRRKDAFDPGLLYDFTTEPDKSKLVTFTCYEWNGDKKPAYAKAGYTQDATDTVGNDAISRFNTYVEFNKPINPMLEGEMTKINQFSPARFRFDGVGPDYIEDAAKSMIDLTGNLLELITHNFRDAFHTVDKGVLLVKDDKFVTPKLIIWDGRSYRDARAIGTYGWGRDGANNFPQKNPVYNTDGKDYAQVHASDIGRSDTCDPVCFGEYSTIWNYPMVYDEMFLGNLWDRFHQIDDPRVNPPMNKNFTAVLACCCDDLQRIGVMGDTSQVKINAKVKIRDKGWFPYGRVESIEVSYDPTARDGRTITLKGKQ